MPTKRSALVVHPQSTLSDQAGGSCSCIEGYVYINYATFVCVPCNSGCSYCISTGSKACVNSKDLTIGASNLASSYALPLLGQTNALH